MTIHLSDEQLVGLLHGTLDDRARAVAKRHLTDCARCAQALEREAVLDEVLWEARRAQAIAPASALAPRRTVRRPAQLRWFVAGAAGLAAATAVGVAGVGGLASATTMTGLDHLLAWQNLIFYIPLAVGLLLVLGSAFGGHDGTGGHDHDAGHDHDQDHDHGAHWALSVLGVGRVPLTIVLMLAALLFGGVGIILNTLFTAAGLPLVVYAPISIAGALAAMVALTGATARLLHRVAPTSETYLVSRHDFAGCVGMLLLPADPTSGYAQIKDPEGNVHNIRCRTARGTLAKGTAILVIEYDPDAQTFVIDASPEAALPPA